MNPKHRTRLAALRRDRDALIHRNIELSLTVQVLEDELRSRTCGVMDARERERVH